MRKGLKITLWGCGTVVVFFVAMVVLAPSIFGWLMAPDHRFGEKPLPDAPDYSLREHWAAWPDNASWWPENTPEFGPIWEKYLEAKRTFPERLRQYEESVKAYEKAKKEYDEAKAAGKPAKSPGRAPNPRRKPRPPFVRNYGISPVDYPVKLTKLIVAMPPSLLYINGEVPVATPVIYLDKLGVEQPPERM